MRAVTLLSGCMLLLAVQKDEFRGAEQTGLAMHCSAAAHHLGHPSVPHPAFPASAFPWLLPTVIVVDCHYLHRLSSNPYTLNT